ncbi:hypothetical protein [Leptolyngbya sp. PCC 6406]|uniref:hypothetical protein n=1 Tax=Leptolyngbya sp. PCC 6406 TaxID=1173264 RepID=UPI00056174EE|nr:hypothetical protein [Leptolyngbya sp. PCC 6406]
MSQSTPVNDIRGQARQGSVAAIIQVLNDTLVEEGIRTRAVIANGMLQLLCEAPTVDQLPQTEVVERVRTILEDLSPRKIRRVHLYSRIVREQQLLWLEEITRNVDDQLLWSEVISLKQPNPFTRFWQDLREPKSHYPIPKGERIQRINFQRQHFWRGLLGGASLCLFLLLVGWAVKNRLGITLSLGQASTEAEVTPEPVDIPPAVPPQQDPFVQAVRLAELAVNDGQNATTAAAWLDLAARWQRASDLMAEVETEDARYRTAQDRVVAYRQNSEQALLRSQQIREAEQADAAAEETPE